MISIKGLNKADVLAALYNHSVPLGMGIFQFKREEMTREAAQTIIDENLALDDGKPFGMPQFVHGGGGKGLWFDYLYGRVMKVDLSGDEFEERLYDRDLGPGAAQEAIDSITSRVEG